MPPGHNPSRKRTLAPGQRVFDRFILKRLLGQGGTGVVWLAHDRVLEQPVALKFLADELLHDRHAVERLKHETRRNLKLSHPNIVRIHDFLQDAHAAAILMEYIEGWSLWTLKVDKPRQIFTVAEITPWLRELFDALGYAHRQAGIVYRDLNPANLLLDGRGQLKITDFGLARNLNRSPTKDFVDLRMVGTDIYMSPQQWSGADPAVTDDIYSIGATIYELLTGKPPFYQGNILDQVYDAVPPRLNARLAELGVRDVQIPAAYEETVAACLSKFPAERPASVNELAMWLGLNETAVSSTPPSSIEPPPPARETPRENPFETEFLDAPPPVEIDGETEVEVKPADSGRKVIVFGMACAVVTGLLLAWLIAAKFIGGASGPAGMGAGKFPEDGKSWQNSLGMKFVPVPGVAGWMCIWETRLQDFTTYVDEVGRAPGDGMLSRDTSGTFKETGHSWRHPEFEQTTNHPVIGISWREAMNFCDWLTTRERATGWLTTNQSYRLPTSVEWLKAAGTNKFVWGDTWPPPKAAGNFAGEEIHVLLPTHPILNGRNDNFAGTAPVGSFMPNALGIYDLAGNVSEFCLDRDEKDRLRRRWLAGGSWVNSTEAPLSVKNFGHIREATRVSDCGFRCLLEFRAPANPSSVEAAEQGGATTR